MSKFSAEATPRQVKTLLAARTTMNLCELYTETNQINQEAATVRGWIMEELESRDATAMDAWVESDIDSPIEFFEQSPIVIIEGLIATGEISHAITVCESHHLTSEAFGQATKRVSISTGSPDGMRI